MPKRHTIVSTFWSETIILKTVPKLPVDSSFLIWLMSPPNLDAPLLFSIPWQWCLQDCFFLYCLSLATENELLEGEMSLMKCWKDSWEKSYHCLSWNDTWALRQTFLEAFSSFPYDHDHPSSCLIFWGDPHIGFIPSGGSGSVKVGTSSSLSIHACAASNESQNWTMSNLVFVKWWSFNIPEFKTDVYLHIYRLQCSQGVQACGPQFWDTVFLR